MASGASYWVLVVISFVLNDEAFICMWWYIDMTPASVLHMRYLNSSLHAWLQTMFVATYSPEEGWRGSLKPYQCLQLEPSAQVLNYGQSVFEGLKAQRSEQGRVVLFRPDQNAARMQAGRLPP